MLQQLYLTPRKVRGNIKLMLTMHPGLLIQMFYFLDLLCFDDPCQIGLQDTPTRSPIPGA